jgi:hypothetical protein
MLKRQIINKYLGRKYDKKTFHCGSLIGAIYEDFGFTVRGCEVEIYDSKWSFKDGINYFAERFDDGWIEVKEPKLLDVVLIDNGKDAPCHGGVMLDNDSFIHCSRQGVVVNRVSDKPFRDSIFGYYRLQARSNND